MTATGISARVVARNTVLRIGGEIVSKLASLAFFVVMARELGQTGFGDFTFALSLAMVLTVLGGFGIDQVMARAIARDRGEIARLVPNALAVKAVFGGLGVVAAVAIALVGDQEPQVRVALVVLTFASLVELLAKTPYAAFLGLDDMGPVAIGLIVQRAGIAAVGIPALLAGAGVAAVAWIYLAGTVAGFAYASGRMIARGLWPKLTFSTHTARALIVGSFALGLAGVFNVVLFRIDMTLVSLYDGNFAVGAYGAAFRLLDATLFVSFSFGAAMLPGLSRLSRTSTPTVAQAFERALKVLMLLLFPVGAAFALFAGAIVDLVYGDEFADAATATRLLGCTAALYGVSYLATSVIIAQDRQRMIPYIVGGALVLNLALNLVFIPLYSFNGAAAVTSATEIALCVATVGYAVHVGGRIGVLRTVLSPLAGCAAMALTALALGDTLGGLAAAAAVYLAVAAAVERLVYPDDLRRSVAAIVRRRPLTGA